MAQNFSGIDPNLLAELRPGEPVLWWGRPDPKRRVINGRSQLSPILIGFLSILVLILLAFDTFVILNLHFLDALLLFAIILINAGLLFSIGSLGYPFVQRRRHVRNLLHTIYAITDQRALIITIVPGKSRAVVSYTKSDIGTISRHEGKEGWGDLIFGVPRPSVVNGRRVMASASFGGIPQVRAAESMMFQTFKRDAASSPLPSERHLP